MRPYNKKKAIPEGAARLLNLSGREKFNAKEFGRCELFNFFSTTKCCNAELLNVQGRYDPSACEPTILAKPPLLPNSSSVYQTARSKLPNSDVAPRPEMMLCVTKLNFYMDRGPPTTTSPSKDVSKIMPPSYMLQHSSTADLTC